MSAFPTHPETIANSAPNPTSPGGYWLVRTGPGASEVQPYSPGLEPLQAKTGAAVYLGTTAQGIAQRITQAAHELGVPDPQNVPSLGTSLGIISGIVAGATAGIAGAGAAADAAAVGAADAAATGAADTAASAGASGAAGGVAGKFASSTAGKVAGAGLAGLLGLTSDWQQILIRALEALAGIALLLLGLQALTGTGGQGSPAATVKRYAR